MPDLTIGAFLVAVIAGLIVYLVGPGVLSLIRRFWRNNPVRRWWGRRRADEDRRLLWAFRELSEGILDRPVAIDDAAKRANVENPGPSVKRLAARRCIVTHGDHDPLYANITVAGQRAEPPRESPVSSEPRPDTPGTGDASEAPQTPDTRSWWRRLFEG
jgi:hypothetical protein